MVNIPTIYGNDWGMVYDLVILTLSWFNIYFKITIPGRSLVISLARRANFRAGTAPQVRWSPRSGWWLNNLKYWGKPSESPDHNLVELRRIYAPTTYPSNLCCSASEELVQDLALGLGLFLDSITTLRCNVLKKSTGGAIALLSLEMTPTTYRFFGGTAPPKYPFRNIVFQSNCAAPSASGSCPAALASSSKQKGDSSLQEIQTTHSYTYTIL